MPSILLLGDSHTFGAYGVPLERMFSKAGWKVTRVGYGGISASGFLNGSYKTWSKSKKVGDFDTAIAKTYDVVIVTLGTNDAAAQNANSDSSAASKAADIAKLASMVRAKSIWYVGAPAFNPVSAANYAGNPAYKVEDLNSRADRLWKAVSPMFPGKAIDPRDVTRPWTKDLDKVTFKGKPAPEIHLGPKGGEAWASLVFDTVVSGEAGLAVGVGEKVAEDAGFPVVPVVIAGLVISALLYFGRKR